MPVQFPPGKGPVAFVAAGDAGDGDLIFSEMFLQFRRPWIEENEMKRKSGSGKFIGKPMESDCFVDAGNNIYYSFSQKSLKLHEKLNPSNI